MVNVELPARLTEPGVPVTLGAVSPSRGSAAAVPPLVAQAPVAASVAVPSPQWTVPPNDSATSPPPFSGLSKPGSVNAAAYASGWPGITVVGPLRAAGVGATLWTVTVKLSLLVAPN